MNSTIEYYEKKITEKIHRLSRDEKMRFNTIEEYDNEIRDIESKLAKFRKYVDNNPDNLGTQTNYKVLEDILYELKTAKLRKIITEIFNHTKDELGMGGGLKSIQCTDNMDFFIIETEYRMDANMMHTIMKYTNSTILLGNSENNVLVFRMK